MPNKLNIVLRGIVAEVTKTATTTTKTEKATRVTKDFAPGIPADKNISPLPTISEETLNRWTLAVQEHTTPRGPHSAKFRTHYDLRLVDPDSGKAHSWALPKARLPQPGEKVLAVQTFTHAPDYALHFGERGPQTIGQGYGKGTVQMALKVPTDVVESSANHLRFNTYEGKEPREYLLRRTNGKSWLLMNTTATKTKLPEVPDSKPKYKETTPEKIDLTRDDQLMQAKIDGAHNSFLLEPGKMPRIFSYRPTERETGLIEHTHRFLPAFKTKVPTDMLKTILRGELVATDVSTGKARGSTDTGAVLNSNVWRSRDLQTQTPLKAVIYDVVSVAGKDVSKKPYAEKLQILKDIQKKMPFLELPPMASTPEEKAELLKRIVKGQEPLTREGVVLWPLQGGAPIKAKFRPDYDVYVRGIKTEKSEKKKTDALAGAIEYSWTPHGPIVGTVGTGFTHKEKADMFKDPAAYLGRVAKVQALEVFKNPENEKLKGALRAPAFKEWHLDKSKEKRAEVAKAPSPGLTDLTTLEEPRFVSQLTPGNNPYKMPWEDLLDVWRKEQSHFHISNMGP